MTDRLPAGVWPVMVTPLTGDDRIDFAALEDQVEWFIGHGAAGLFTVSMSSEMYYLSDAERLGLATGVVEAVRGRIGVVATGTFGGALAGQAEFVKRMHATGVDAVVVIASQLADEGADDEMWRAAAGELMELADGVPLGIYECPRPYHRLLTPESIGWLASTGRYLFHKDTCTDIDQIRAKIAAARGTSFGFYNAQTATLLESLQAGGHGYSGTASNYFPSLYAWLCGNFDRDPATAVELQRFLCTVEPAIRMKYPNAAKLFESLYGVPITPRSRMLETEFTDDDRRVLTALKETVDGWRARLGMGH